MRSVLETQPATPSAPAQEARSSAAIGEAQASPRTFLFVGGPYGPFFRELAQALEARGARTERIALNAAEWLRWHGRPCERFVSGLEVWPSWFESFLEARSVTDLVTYGDCDPYSRAALSIAERRAIRRHVFEAGYLRPDWITLEAGGVNGYSRLPREPAEIRKISGSMKRPAPHRVVPHPLRDQIGLAFYDGMLALLGRPFFPRSRDRFLHGPGVQALTYPVGFLRRAIAGGRLRREIGKIRSLTGPYYLFLLQRERDSQILCHSRFASVAESYEAVLACFARSAPVRAHIVVKNHPLDPFLIDHGARIRNLAMLLGIQERVHFIWGGSLADLTRAARGVITVNSTAGLAAVQFGVPTIALGRAVYAVEGLTYQGSLDEFFRKSEPPDPDLFRAFRTVLTNLTQINGSFYSPEGRKMAVAESIERLMQE